MLASKTLKHLKNYYLRNLISKIILLIIFTTIAAKSNAGYRDSFISFEARTGTILSEKRGNTKVYPASMTKILTAHIILRDIENLEMKTTVSENAWGHKFGNSSRMFLEPQMEVCVEQLLYGLMVQSGNDAAVALAELHSGSVQSFSKEMNKTAKRFGAKSSNFVNPHGRHNKNHYTTAVDFMKITIGVMNNTPEITHFTKTPYFTFNEITQYNRNKAIKHLKNIGLKTGFTPQSGYNLTSCYDHNNGIFCTVEFGNNESEARFTKTFNEFETNFRLRKVFVIPTFEKTYISGEATYAISNNVQRYYLGLQTDEMSVEVILEKKPNGSSTIDSKLNVKIDDKSYQIDLPSSLSYR